ncbi:MAG: CBS domain-containing protein [Polyangiaceae bacterium]
MNRFSSPVSQYHSHPVRQLAPGDSLEYAKELLELHQISALAVTEQEALVGVITRTDLLRVGRRQAGTRRGAELLVLPNKAVAEVMTRDPSCVAPTASVAEASKLMLEGRVHRVFVCDDRRLRGIFSTRDAMRAIADKRVATPIVEHASRSVYSVQFDDPVALAAERLEKAHVSGLVVVENDWPIGIFSQVEALASRDLPRETRVEEVLDPAMLCLDVATPLFRAAAQASAMDVQRILVIDDRKCVGVLSGLDMVRVSAE